MVTPSSPHVVPVGSQVTLVCSASGDPSPSVQWIAPASSNVTLKPVEVKPGVLQIVIEEITSQDEGNYKCVASNVVGEDEATLDMVGKLLLHNKIILLRLLLKIQRCYARVFLTGFLWQSARQYMHVGDSARGTTGSPI